MIKANELRIGNWIYYNGKLSKIDLTDFRDILEDEYEINYYKPIPLTEEILLKCEFEFLNTPNKYGWFKSVSNRNLCWCHSDFVSLEHITEIDGFNDTLFDFECKHLNQLQNLYFALTGKELEINL